MKTDLAPRSSKGMVRVSVYEQRWITCYCNLVGDLEAVAGATAGGEPHSMRTFGAQNARSWIPFVGI